jgi:hypothetical protein
MAESHTMYGIPHSSICSCLTGQDVTVYVCLFVCVCLCVCVCVQPVTDVSKPVTVDFVKVCSAHNALHEPHPVPSISQSTSLFQTLYQHVPRDTMFQWSPSLVQTVEQAGMQNGIPEQTDKCIEQCWYVRDCCNRMSQYGYVRNSSCHHGTSDLNICEYPAQTEKV